MSDDLLSQLDAAVPSELDRVTRQRDAAVEALADIIGTMTLEGVPQSIIEKCAAKARAALALCEETER